MFKILTAKKVDPKFFASQLKIMLKSGLNLNRSLFILKKQSRKSSQQQTYKNILKDIESGLTLSESLEKSQQFSELFIEVVAAGENSGTLVQVLNSLEDYYKNKEDLKKEIKKACFYPLTVICAVFLSGIFILKFILPVFIDLFNDFEGELPLISRLFLDLSEFLNDYFILIIIFLIFLIIFLVVIFKNGNYAELKSKFFLRIPFINNLYRNLILSQIAVYLSLFLRSGLDLISALEYMVNIINDQQYKDFIKNTALNISKGASLSECFSDSKYIPDLFYYLLITGEESAQMETMLERAGDYYYHDLKEGIAKMLQYLEPLLISLTAIFVALLAAAVIMPMFQLYLII